MTDHIRNQISDKVDQEAYAALAPLTSLDIRLLVAAVEQRFYRAVFVGIARRLDRHFDNELWQRRQ